MPDLAQETLERLDTIIILVSFPMFSVTANSTVQCPPSRKSRSPLSKILNKQPASNWRPANVDTTIIAPTWERNDIRNVEVARGEYRIWTTCFAPRMTLKCLVTSIITSPWQRNDIGIARVAKRLTLCTRRPILVCLCSVAVAAVGATVERELDPRPHVLLQM